MKCDCCESELYFKWTDTHGIGVCTTCGLPYQILFYEGEGEAMKRIEKLPEMAVDAPWLPICKRYWLAKKRRVVPGCYDLGPLRRFDGDTYSGATQEDCWNWDNWCKRHKSELPKPEPEPEAATTPPA